MRLILTVMGGKQQLIVPQPVGQCPIAGVAGLRLQAFTGNRRQIQLDAMTADTKIVTAADTMPGPAGRILLQAMVDMHGHNRHRKPLRHAGHQMQQHMGVAPAAVSNPVSRGLRKPLQMFEE